jgi:hypothetical protein
MKRITFLIGLFLFSSFGFGQSANNSSLQTIETFHSCHVPLTTFSITKDKSFWDNIKSKSPARADMLSVRCKPLQKQQNRHFAAR